MQVILDAANSYAPGPSLNNEAALSALKAFRHDTTILAPDVSHAHDKHVWMNLTDGAG